MNADDWRTKQLAKRDNQIHQLLLDMRSGCHGAMTPSLCNEVERLLGPLEKQAPPNAEVLLEEMQNMYAALVPIVLDGPKPADILTRWLSEGWVTG